MKNRCLLLVLSFILLINSQALAYFQPGDQVPNIVAETVQGELFDLYQWSQEGPVVIIFYRGSWCPYCNIQLRDFSEHYSEFKDLNARVVAISVDRKEKSMKSVELENFNVELVSDSDASILEKFSLTFTAPKELSEKYLNEYNIDLKGSSGRSDGLIAKPATLIVGLNGKLLSINVHEDYKVRMSASQVLSLIDNFDEFEDK